MMRSRAKRPVAALYTAALVGCVVAAAAVAAPAGWKLGGNPARGQASFAKRCALCHGEKGDAKSQAAQNLTPRPADLTDPKVMAKRSDWDLYRVVKDGGPAIGLSSTMMGWEQVMPDAEIRDVTAYVRGLSRKK